MLVREVGPDHRKEFVTAVLANGEELGRGIEKVKVNQSRRQHQMCAYEGRYRACILNE